MWDNNNEKIATESTKYNLIKYKAERALSVFYTACNLILFKSSSWILQQNISIISRSCMLFKCI